MNKFADYFQMIKDIQKDEGLKARIKEANITDIDGLVAFANSMGYKFDKYSIPLCSNETPGDSQELSDADLEAVAGGKGSGACGSPGNVTCTSLQCYQYTTAVKQVCSEISC
ncbi:MAG: hypothetical protein CVV64_16650 [Candidatus Wallbacteria bacterium HGW-Wallbacteria-1]|jgi:predicted ribosomally synthesized peptide with nif11-like leader|uniref:Nif11 domain-containing protein n=1 Tax=Candidatus Wallbacteria bacterium HGW-Wallbacteria-1 TaxID=2013854 RepID=A0A2N1PKU9_9BACT|nr:MAG: hypothetical protein CVV64_16650 [Candidatus Wallbacteria bacterium HGW-Wallbacteria-1]